MRLGRDFMLFRFGQLVSLIGDACTNIALPWWVLAKTGSAEKMALIVVPGMIVKICLLPLLGPIGDRFSRKKVAALGDYWSGIAALAMTAMAYLDYFNIPLLITLNIAIAIGSALFMSVTSSIIPQLVAKQQIAEAVQQGQAISVAGTIIGSLAGGMLATFAGIPGAFLIDALSFLAAGTASFLIKSKTRPLGGLKERELSPGNWFKEILSGIYLVKSVPILLWTAIIAGVINFCFAPMSIALPYLIKETRHMAPWVLGIAQASMSLGLFAGSLAAGRLCSRIFEDWLVVGGVVVLGVGFALLPFISNPVMLCLTLFVAGAGLMVCNIPAQARRVLSVPDSCRSRVESIYNFVRSVAMPGGVWMAGILISHWGIAPAMAVCGALLSIFGLALYLVPKLSLFYRLPPEKVETFIADFYPEAFKERHE